MGGDNGHRDEGEKLADLPRYGGARLVITLEQYEGHHFIALRALDPAKGNRQLTVKVRELDQVIGALQAAKAKIGGGQ